MPIANYQVPFPTGLSVSDFELTPIFKTTAPVTFPDGFLTISEVADPTWKLSFTFPFASRKDAMKARAWKASLRGGQKTFLCPCITSPFPKAYASKEDVLALTRFGGGAFDGTATISSFTDATRFSIDAGSANKVPANFALCAGDVIAVVRLGARPKYSLHFVVTDTMASAGGVLSIDVEPRINTGVFFAGDTVVFVDPTGEFVLDPSSQSDGRITLSDNSVSIEAVSYLRA